MDSLVEGNILLVGDGDFSLTTALLRYHSPQQITTTSLETESSILKHKDALVNRERLTKQGTKENGNGIHVYYLILTLQH